MMTKLSTVIMFVFFTLTVNVSNAQVYLQGNVVIDAFYGFPNFYTASVRSKYNANNSNYNSSQYGMYQNPEVKSLGALGATVEYLLNDKMGIGLEGTYATTILEADYYESINGNTYRYTESFTRLRVLPRMNFHFGSSDKVDPYLAFGIGFYDGAHTYITKNPYHRKSDYKATVPISYRIGFGIRYFFAERVGFMVEFGFGGPLARGGLCAKF